MIVVSDASPLIALAAISRLELIRLLYGNVIVPQAVYHEVSIAGQGKPGAQVLQASWIEVHQVTNKALVAQLEQNLGPGEAEAIALAVELGADRLLIDEHRGRIVATSYGLAVTGLLGILLVAKQQGLLPAIRPILDDLRARAGFRVSDQLYRRVLQTAGE